MFWNILLNGKALTKHTIPGWILKMSLKNFRNVRKITFTFGIINFTSLSFVMPFQAL